MHERPQHLEVTLDRPKANAIDLATSRVMGKVFADFRDDPTLLVAILRTAGDKFFSAGWDLKAAAGGGGRRRRRRRLRRRWVRRAPGTARAQQAGDRGRARSRHGWWLRARPLVRPDLCLAAQPVRPSRDQRGHPGRRCHDQAAQADALVFAAIKEVARAAEDAAFQDVLDQVTGRTLATVDTLYGSEDGLEGFKAFAEKRPPVWKGR